MGTITAQSVINKAAIQLTDVGNARWTRAELLDWLNQGQKQIVVMSPSATNKVSVVQLTSGTRQSIPSDGWTLLELIRYMGTNGSTPGRAIRVTSRELIDAFNPNWHADAKSAAPKHYIFDAQDQTVFYVYPPSNGQGYVQLNYSPVPPMITSESTVISVSDTFEPALLDYILYRACSKDAEYAPGLQLASGYLSTFMAAMQIKSTSELANNPNQNFAPKDPSKPGSES
ncbi:hypothetical protein UFOVP285_8 [uncultured Caudovirales phage]|jgi:hypothetical protein|uniref:Uncharacterized protein n=1 Tax=uncultured Caudovirales phage TaxID=2100421 RepID=A0A6J5LLA9_9CAUD|nr:hypothetical protein UFOVP285_8 [uncultured Caudovirales phage]